MVNEEGMVLFQSLEFALQICNYFFTGIFILEAAMKVYALGCSRYLYDRFYCIHIDSKCYSIQICIKIIINVGEKKYKFQF